MIVFIRHRGVVMLKPVFGVGDRVLNVVQATSFESEADALAFFAAGVAQEAERYGSSDLELVYVGEFDTVGKRVIRKPLRVIATAADVLKRKH